MSVHLSAAVGSPVIATMSDGKTYTFERATPRILAELGSWYRAQSGVAGGGWTSIEDAIKLVRTLEGMEWLAWRCACKHHADVKQRGPMGFREATNDFSILTALANELTDYPDPERTENPRQEPEVEKV
jgi:hypothetical protein